MYKTILTIALIMCTCNSISYAAEPITECQQQSNRYNCTYAYRYFADEKKDYEKMWDKYQIAYNTYNSNLAKIRRAYLERGISLIDSQPPNLVVSCCRETWSKPPYSNDIYWIREYNVGNIFPSMQYVTEECAQRWYKNNLNFNYKQLYAPQLSKLTYEEWKRQTIEYKKNQQAQAEYEASMKAQGKKYVCTEAYCEWQ